MKRDIKKFYSFISTDLLVIRRKERATFFYIALHSRENRLRISGGWIQERIGKRMYLKVPTVFLELVAAFLMGRRSTAIAKGQRVESSVHGISRATFFPPGSFSACVLEREEVEGRRSTLWNSQPDLVSRLTEVNRFALPKIIPVGLSLAKTPMFPLLRNTISRREQSMARGGERAAFRGSYGKS